jgi:isochorismate synthase
MSVSASTSVSARLSALVDDARARARETGRSVLVSVAERVPVIDPLEALEGMAQVAGTGGATTASDRMYWTRPADEFALAGFGAVVLLERGGTDRFGMIDRQWAMLRRDAAVDDPSAGAAGVGPLLMGGFAFEPDGPRSDRWRDFPSGRLFVPRVQVAATRGEHWLTMNLLVGPDGAPDIDPAALVGLRKRAVESSAGRRSPRVPATTLRLGFAEALPPSEWRSSVEAIVRGIRSGVLEKVVLAREVRINAPRDFDVGATLDHLRSKHQASYVFGCWHGGSAFVGASPELLVSVDGTEVHASSLAGSVARGSTTAHDAALAAELLASAKDRVEHEVVRRALVTGMSELCDDVVANDEPSLLSLPQVHHLHTDVRGRLREGHSLLDLVAQLHPTPAVGGEPRDTALRFIREHEGIDRGWYAGPIGWLQQGRGEFAVALRSALITGPEAAMFAGCGIVADSDPDSEYAESQLKLQAMEMALAGSVAKTDSIAPGRAVAAGRTAR